MKKNQIRRGDIFYYDYGENEGNVQNGIRPVLILQCNEGNNVSSTTIIAAITSAVKKKYLPTHIFLGAEYGLRENSMVLLEQIATINQSQLERFVGHVDDDLMRVVNNALKKGLGMWNYAPKKNEIIRCSCWKCLNCYLNGKYIVKRADPYNRIKEPCEICGRPGYNYLISERTYGVRKDKVTDNE